MFNAVAPITPASPAPVAPTLAPVSRAAPTAAVQARTAQTASRAELQAEDKRPDDDSRAQRGTSGSPSVHVAVSAEGMARARAEPTSRDRLKLERFDAGSRGPATDPSAVGTEARPPKGPPPGAGAAPPPGRGEAPDGPPPPATDPVKTVSVKVYNPADANTDGKVSDQEQRSYDVPLTAQKDQVRPGSRLNTQQGEEATRVYMAISQQVASR